MSSNSTPLSAIVVTPPTKTPKAHTTTAPRHQTSLSEAVQIDCQKTPVLISGTNGRLIAGLMIEHAVRSGNLIFVSGWSLGNVRLAFTAEGREKLHTALHRFARTDVTDHFQLNPSTWQAPGFITVLFAPSKPNSSSEKIALAASRDTQPWHHQTIQIDTQPGALKTPLALLHRYLPELLLASSHDCDVIAFELATSLPPSPGECPYARGFIETAYSYSGSSVGALSGWAFGQSGIRIWIEDGDGGRWPLDTTRSTVTRYRRGDVAKAFADHFGHHADRSGVLAALPGVTSAGGAISIRASDGKSLYVLHEVTLAENVGDPVRTAQWLAGIPCDQEDYIPRVERTDWRVLGPLVSARQVRLSRLETRIWSFGTAPEDPHASIIVPLYARYDFVEHQLVEFARDDWLLGHAEVIYVIDDPRLITPLRATADELWRLYRVPFSLVWGGTNRGYSAANNLGASVACGKILVFLNSDVFPKTPGWLENLVQTLDRSPDFGAIAPRLVFADGGIQHAGMRFEYRSQFGVWINHHPFVGLASELDPTKILTDMPAITGACFVTRRTAFDTVGGFDTGYLIGDFEDSDLCLKLRVAGYRIGYEPRVELIHLERQSFKSIGDDTFRMRVVLYNASRHQMRWRHMLEQVPTSNRPE